MAILELFTRIQLAKRQPDVTCNFCTDMIRNAQPGRGLVSHVTKCGAIPIDKKYECLMPCIRCDEQSRPRKRSAEDEWSVQTEENANWRPCTCGAGKVLKSFQVPHEMMQKIRVGLAQAIYSSGAPFMVVSSIRFRRFVRMMCPGFIFPARARVAADLLRNTYNQERDIVIAKPQRPPFLTLVTDGWTNPNQAAS